ncbi:hypothetical protein Tco_1287952 [Tanacetum coccineum]
MTNVGQGEPKQSVSKQAAAPKQAPPNQELQPHPTMEKLYGVQIYVNTPPPWSTDISKITRKQSRSSNHGHENQKSTKRSQRIKAEARNVKPQSKIVNHGQ